MAETTGSHVPDHAVLPALTSSRGTSLTVALCTHNQKERLQRTLRGLAQLSRPANSWELLIIDNASTDGTSELVTTTDWSMPDITIRVVQEEKLGISNARNRAVKEAIGEYIVFVDDDETPDPHWLSAYERVILTERPDALGGRIEVLFEDCGRPAWLQEELLGFLGRLDHGGTAHRLGEPGTAIFTGNAAFRREVFARIGLFDTALGRKGKANFGGEDVEMYRRMIDMGCNVWWVPDAVIYHRIQVGKLHRRYFLDLHFHQGRTEGMRRRGQASRFPPAYLFPQLLRAIRTALSHRFSRGGNASLRKEMNVAYFIGYLYGWAFGSYQGK